MKANKVIEDRLTQVTSEIAKEQFRCIYCGLEIDPDGKTRVYFDWCFRPFCSTGCSLDHKVDVNSVMNSEP